jgi:hypothetical protein
MPLKTPNDGAAQERAAIKRFINRNASFEGKMETKPLIDFINTRAARASKKAGGLGRKR